MPEMPHSPTPIDLDMQDPANGLRRIPLLGNSVNKGERMKSRLTAKCNLEQKKSPEENASRPRVLPIL
jgi:hypothetical protein